MSQTLIAFLLGLLAGVGIGILFATAELRRIIRQRDDMIATWHPAAPCEESRASLNTQLRVSRWMARTEFRSPGERAGCPP